MSTVTYEDIDRIRIIRLNRPDALNAFNSTLMAELASVLNDTAANGTTNVAILTGEGRAFSAGADLAAWGDKSGPANAFDLLLDAILDFPIPFIVAVNGLGVGIGATIVGLADLTLMAESARLKCPFSSLGVTAEAGSTITFPALMGRQRANWFLWAAEWMSARDCYDAGLCIELTSDDDLMTRALARAEVLAKLPTSSIRKTKSLMMEPIKDALRAQFTAENKGLAELSGSPANREAIAAFIEKREPDFSGLSS
ncbi:MAG: enoyl-CoA hydratase/isomerase family protein [Pseudomonadales bacterium]|nr:enoyl-CoA hydratase/isomerase family protein [Pseudomonadales bacterium]